MKQKEKIYIKKRKCKAFINGLRYWICSIFPIKKKRIAICTYEGKGGFGCSPRYIVEELHKRDVEYEFIWFVNDINKQFPEYIKKVENTPWNRAYWMSTSKVWIDNYRTPFGTKKRKGQIYINTWHGAPCIKPIGKYRGDLFPKIARIVSEDDSKKIDFLLSGSGWSDEHYRDGLVYEGEIVRTGSPRCDILFNGRESRKKELKKELNISEEGKILMYAPTFRGGSQSMNRLIDSRDMQIDFEKLMEALEKRFGGQWYILLRLHPQLAANNECCEISNKSERLRDVTKAPDMNALMAGIDGFITDYSSAIFEACLMKIPCFIYADDLADYVRERGDLFFDMNALPFPLAMDNKQLIENIEFFDDVKYQKELQQFVEAEDITEDGRASEKTADLIEMAVNDKFS